MLSNTKSITTVVAVALFMAASLSSFAQTSRFSITFNSLTTNFNYGRLNKDLQPYKKNFTGLQLGTSYQIGISPMVSLVPELNLAMKGGVLTENNPLTIHQSTVRLYSVELPFLARLHVHRFYLNAGPYGSYLVGGRLKQEGTDGTPSSTTKMTFGNAPGDFTHWDVGWLAGVGYNFNLKRTNLMLDARYGYGFINLSNSVERYNRMLNISLVVSKPSRNKTQN
ncbi:porin family protein [Spirosoma gilvum]